MPLRAILLLLLLGSSQWIFAQVVVTGVTKTVGGTVGADYQTLGSAFSAINSGILTGDITLKIIASTTEASAATLNQNAGMSSLTIYPTQPGLSITGNGAFAVVSLSGADNVTIDGRVNAAGSTASLTIENVSTITTGGNRAVLFDNDATHNVLQYCIIKAVNARDVFNAGIIAFGSNAPLVGNDNNRIANCRFTHAQSNNRSVIVIYSDGSFQANKENSGNEIIDNEFVDCFYTGSVTQPSIIFIGNYNTNWTVQGNHFFETTTLAATTNNQFISAIRVSCLNGGCTNFTFSDNYIGGSERSCGGSALAINSSTALNFNGILIASIGATGGSNIQGNQIANINLSGTEVSWKGIEVASNASCYIGNLTANVIGSDTTAGSIQINTTTGNNFLWGIRGIAFSDDAMDTLLIANNKVGGAVLSTTTSGAAIINGIGVGGNTSKIRNVIIQNNLIGSSSMANSLMLDASVIGGSKRIEGINMANIGVNVIANNLVANILNTDRTTNNTAGTRGIFAGRGSTSIYDNQIYEVSHTGKNSSSNLNAPLQGISLFLINGNCSIERNTIRDLRGIASNFNGQIFGIYVQTAAATATGVSNNHIYGLHAPAGATTAAGIKLDGDGAAVVNNNLVWVDNNINTATFGLQDLLTAQGSLSMYHNTWLLSGTLPAGSNSESSCFVNQADHQFLCKNNLFVNTRSTPGATDKHYSFRVQTNTIANLTLDNNNYYVSGEGSTIARFWTNIYKSFSCWRESSFGQNAGSTNENPAFTDPAGTTLSSFIPTNAALIGTAGTGITEDLAGATRSLTSPAMGALEYTVAASADIAVEYPACTNLLDSVSVVDFGSATTGNNVDRVLKLISVGRADLSGLSVAVEGSHAADFTVTPLTSGTLSAGQNTNLSVRFTPTGTGSRTALLKISSNDPDENTFDLQLSGTGLACLTVYNVTGGGTLCEGAAGVAIGLSGSAAGVSYQLKKDGVNEGSPLAGTGAALDFGALTAAGQYTVTATQGSCSVSMADTAYVVVNTVTAGAIAADQSYCLPTDAAQLSDTLAASGQGTLAYQWQSGSTGVDNWADIAQATTAAYDPSTLSATTYFRRKAISTLDTVVCEAFSNVISVVIGDVTPPTLSCPANQTRNVPGACSYTASGTEFNLLSSSDNCGVATTAYALTGATTGSGSNSLANVVFENGNTTIQWIVTDNEGNRDSCSLLLTVTGAVPVVIDSCPSATTVEVAAASCVFTADSLLNPLVSGGCGAVMINYSLEGIHSGTGTDLSGYSFSPGQTTVRWNVEDALGNRDSCQFVLTVEDNQLPTISCATNQTIFLDGQSCDLTVADAGFDPVATADNCGVATVSNDFNQTASLAGAVLPPGLTTIVWTASDVAGNTASCSLLLTVTDSVPPTLSCQNVEVLLNGESSVVLDASDFAMATDNCGVESLTLSQASVDCSAIGTTLPVTVTAEDAAGNQTTCTTELTVGGLPCGWNHDSDGIGCTGGSSVVYDPAQETFTLASNGCYYVTPYNSDELAYLSRSLCGDGSIQVRINQFNGNGWAGISLRENDQPGARKFQLTITNQRNTVRREIRSAVNASSVFAQVPRFNTQWLRIVRIGNTVVGYASANGTVWSQIGAVSLPLGSCVEVGLLVSQNNPVNGLNVVFGNLQVMSQNYSGR